MRPLSSTTLLICSALVLWACVPGPATETPSGASTNEQDLQLGLTLAHAPAVVRTDAHTLDVFAPADDATVWTRRFDETSRAWGAWSRVSANPVAGSGIAAVVDGSGAVRLFTRHPVVNGVMTLQLRRVGGSWSIGSDWRVIAFPALLTRAAPAVTRDADGVLHLFTSYAETHELAHTSCANAADCSAALPTWAPWEAQSLLVYSTPAVVSLSPGEFDLYFEGRDVRVRESKFRPAPYPYRANWTTPVDLGESSVLTVFPPTTSPAWPFTVAAALAVDNRQGLHRIANARTNTLGESNYRGSCAGNGAEAVMRLDLPQEARVQLDTFGADFDTVLYVRNAAGAEVVDALGVVACNDDANSTVQSALDLRLPAGTWYLFLDNFWAGPAGAGKQPTVNVAISYVNAPTLVSRVVSGVQVTDVYTVGLDGRLAVNSRNGVAWSGWRTLDALDPVTEHGDLSNTRGLSAVQSSQRAGCSHVFGRTPGSRALFEKGCTTAAVSLDNHALTWSSGEPTTSLVDSSFTQEWGQLNSAWNRTVNFGDVGTMATSTTGAALTAAWPAELYLFNFDDYRTSWTGAWNFDSEAHAFAALAGNRDGWGAWWSADRGALTSSAELPMPVRAARLVNHGSCVTRMPWDDGLPYAAVHTGLLNRIQRTLNDGLYLGAASAMAAVSEHWSSHWNLNRYSPTFVHFSVDGVTANHSDGFAFRNEVQLNDDGRSIIVGADAHYVTGLLRGVPVVKTLSHQPRIWTSAGFDATVLVNLNARLLGSLLGPLAPEPLGGPGPCDSLEKEARISCQLTVLLPTMLRTSFLEQMTAILGDPMAATACVTATDCGAPPYGGGEGVSTWVCHVGRCMVPIGPSQNGYSATRPDTNFRTEFDTTGGGLENLSNCEAVAADEPLDASSLTNCQAALEQALIAKGLDNAAASTLAKDPSMVANRQFGCVVPRRPNCTPGVTDFPGYRCMDADAPVGTGRFNPDTRVRGRCTWRPAFKRLVVTPTDLELVWSEEGEVSVSERIVQTLSPASSCQAPTPSTSGATPRGLPLLSNEGAF